MPIVFSVPKKTKCRSGVETKLNLDAVGAPDIAVALVLTPDEVSHLKAPPFKAVAMRSSPKLSNDHCLASNVTFDVDLGVPHVEAPHVSVPQPKAEVDTSGPIEI